MAKNVKYAVIGAGAIAQRRHLPEIHQNPDSTVVAIADPNAERVKTIADRYDAQPFTDWKKMLKEVEVDAVVVAGPNAFHAEQTIAALKAGFHVLVEKPMATTRAEAKKMMATAKSTGKYLMIGMNQRLMPPHVKAKEILETGKLGRILAFETNFKHGGPDGWSVDGAKSWFFKRDQAVMGVNGDLGIHKADLMRYLLGEEFTHVGGFVETRDKKVPGTQKLIPVDDNAYLTLKTESGTIGSIHISWTAYGHGDNSTYLHCEHGVMRLGVDPQWGVMVDYRNGNKERYEVGAMATNEKQVSSGVSDSFTKCIQDKKKPSIDGSEGYRALNVILTAVEAAKEGTIKKIKH